MKRVSIQIYLVVLLSLVYVTGTGQEWKKMEIGDPAPGIVVKQWIKGQPVTKFQPGQLYVVEFSGTWCPPCLAEIPNLTRLAKKYTGKITMVSIYSERPDRNKPTDVSYIERVRVLVKEMGSRMEYTVAVEDPKNSMSGKYWVDGYPDAFIVDGSGKIAWRCHPASIGTALEEFANGTFDINVARKREVAIANIYKDMDQLKKEGNYPEAVNKLDSLILVEKDNKAGMYYYKFHLLAGSNDEAAYKWLQFILDSKIEGFDWPHFLGSFREIKKENRNYKIEIKAYQRTIEEAQTTFHTSSTYYYLAFLYAEMGNYKSAENACLTAIERSKAPGGDEYSKKKCESVLPAFQYMNRANQHLADANRWVKNNILNKKVLVDTNLVKAIIERNAANLDLAMQVLDMAIQQTKDINAQAQLIIKKSELYEQNGDWAHAIQACEKAIEVSNKSTITYFTKKYEIKLQELKSKSL